MVLKGSQRADYISWLRDNTQYTLDYIRSLDDHRLYRIYMRISQAIPQYIKEILDKVNSPGYVGKQYTRLELTKYSYNELADLRKSLGIRKSRKKVTKVEPAPEQTMKKAGDILHQMSIDELCENIFNSNEEQEEHEHEEFLNTSEIQSAYGEDIPSEEVLKQKGIVNLDSNDSIYHEKLGKRIVIKDEILKVIKQINTSNPVLLKLSIKEIEALDFRELVEEYRKLQALIPSIPQLEDMDKGTGLKKS